jgi:hypothetical protein
MVVNRIGTQRTQICSWEGRLAMMRGLIGLCAAYDEAQAKSRDLNCRAEQDHPLVTLHERRKEIERVVDVLMSQIAATEEMETPELVYFNSWFNRRGGWSATEWLC